MGAWQDAAALQPATYARRDGNAEMRRADAPSGSKRAQKHGVETKVEEFAKHSFAINHERAQDLGEAKIRMKRITEAALRSLWLQ